MLWPYIVVFAVLALLMLLSVRNRKRAVAEDLVRVSRIGVGTEVMTTSGLYGTVVAKHDDGTVLLSIAPGIEVKWAAAALRDAPSLSEDYRRALDEPGDSDADSHPDSAAEGIDLHKSEDGS